MTRLHGFGTGDSEGAAQGHHAFTDLYFAQTGVAGAEDDQLGSLQVKQRRLQAGEKTVFGDCIGHLFHVIGAGQGDAAADHWVLQVILWEGSVSTAGAGMNRVPIRSLNS